MSKSSMDMEWWKAFFEVGGVVLLFLTFTFGAGVVLTGNKVNKRQAERLRTFDTDLTSAKLELAKQQERAAKAEGSIALAEQHASEANTKAEGFRLDIAKSNESSVQAQAQVATATAEAAIARLATEKLKAVITWRTISPQSVQILEKLLSAKPGVVNLRYTDSDPEALYLAIQFSEILSKANWQIASGSMKIPNGIQLGIALPDSAGVSALTLRSAFSAAKIDFSTSPLPRTRTEFDSQQIPGAPVLMIGSRPPIAP